MKSVVVYESMYGNTHLIADAIAAGLVQSPADDVHVVSVAELTPEMLGGADLVVVGGPTHVHGMSRPSTRKAAVDAAEKPSGKDLYVEPDAEGPGLREWFDKTGWLPRLAAAFDTRIDASPVVTGRASKGIAKRLRTHGCSLVVQPQSFLVTKDNHLIDDEMAVARDWGAGLATAAQESNSPANG